MAQRRLKMKTFDNSLRAYNKRVLSKWKMNTYTKNYIDNMFNNAILTKCEVSIKKLTAEDIANYKLSLIKSKDNAKSKKDGNAHKDDNSSKGHKKSKVVKMPKDKNKSIDGEPAKKKQKLDTNGIDVLKLVLSREGETDKFKAQFKSSLKPNKEVASTSTNEDTIVIDDCEESTESTESTESAESTTSSTTDFKPRIWVMNPKKMMDEDMLIRWRIMSSPDTKIKRPINGGKKSTVAEPSTSESSQSTNAIGIKLPLNNKAHAKENLIIIEKLYNKYFSKSVQDTIVIIANILNIISMSNKHHKARMDESFKKRSEAEKLKERCDANRLHARHKNVLETKLKSNFVQVVSSFEESEFDSAFQMFFLSILTVLRVLDQPKFKKGSIFKNLVLLLWNSLKNSEFNHPNIFAMFRSKTFRPDCIDLISLIEDSRDSDPAVTGRMSLFFVSTVNSREYFQAVINAVTSDSNEDLALLIDNATFQCCINSKFKDPVDSSTVQHSIDRIPSTVQHSINKIPSTVQSSINKIPSTGQHSINIIPSTVQHSINKIPSTVQHSINKIPPTHTITSPIINSAETVQHWFLAKNPDGTYQQIPLLNGNKPQTIGTSVEPSIVTSQPLNNFYESFSSSLQTKPSETCTSQTMPVKKCIVVTQTISNGPMVQAIASSSQTATSAPPPTTYVTFKPPIQTKKPMANTLLQRAEGSTIVLGNKQYQLVKGPTGQMRAVVNGANILVKPSSSSNVKCFAKNCNSPSTIMCSSCTKVKYCSHDCQRSDWYDSHINDCVPLPNKSKTQP